MAKERKNNGWICLHRAMREWQWYDNPIIKAVFIDLLFSACTEPTWFKGRKLGRGQTVISVDTLAANNGITKPTVIKALRQLEDSGEIVRNKWKFYVITTIRNYAKYQDFGQKVSKNNLPTSLPTSLPNKQYNNNNNNVVVDIRARARGIVDDMLQSRISVEGFCKSAGITVEQFSRLADEVLTEWELVGKQHQDEQDAKRHLLDHIRKKAQAQSVKAAPPTERKARFLAQCRELVTQGYPKAEVAEFATYYTQPTNDGSDRMLFETYPAWDTRARFLLNQKRITKQ